jgi:hypothetical protein
VVVLLDGSIRFDGPVTAFLDLAPAGVQRPAEAAYAQIAFGRH